MSSLYKRGRKLYADIKGVDGQWRQIATGFDAGQEDGARAWIKDREREIDAELRRLRGEPEPVVLTLSLWAAEWRGKRVALGKDSNHDYERIRNHVLPRIGDLPIASIEPRHIVDVMATIQTTAIKTATGLEPPAPRTVHNIYTALVACFRGARLAGKIAQSPCILTEAELGSKRDKDPEWRDGAVFTREEARTLISTSKIPWDRRVAYALELLAGVRPGESAALRWRHYRDDRRPLGQLVVALSHNSKRGATKGTKTESVKHVPVHATLAATLAEWRDVGWPAMVGRAPEPDDLIVPLPPADAAARTRRAESDPYRTTYYAGRRWRDADLPALGWRERRHYDLRATFVTLALEDGADKAIIRERVTHTKPGRDAFDGYDRGVRWAETCAEISRLDITRAPNDADLAATAANLPALILQSENTEMMTDTYGLRRRASNPRPGG